MQTGVRTAQLTIVTREGDARELKRLVDAIADAYEQEIVAERFLRSSACEETTEIDDTAGPSRKSVVWHGLGPVKIS